jgi:hypothetical protein
MAVAERAYRLGMAAGTLSLLHSFALLVFVVMWAVRLVDKHRCDGIFVVFKSLLRHTC